MSREVPEGWSLMHLGDVCEIGGGVGFKETMQGHRDLPYPFIKVSDMNDPGNEIEIQSARNYVDAQMLKAMGAKLFPAGSVVLPKVGAAALTNKRRRLAMPTAVDNNLMVWTPTSVDPTFLFHWSMTIDIATLVQTGALPSLNKTIAESISLVLPPHHEQRRIAEILSSVDEAIAATRAVIEQTRKVKQGVLERLLTKGIGHTRFKQTEIGEIPEGWAVRRLADLAEDSRNSFVIGPFGSDLTVKDYCDEGVPVVFVRDVQSDRFRWKSEVYVSPEKAERLRAHSARPGDIVITKMGLPPGIAAEIPPSFENSIVTADIVRLRPNTKIASSAFLAIALNGERVADAVAEITGGQTRPKITLRDYKSISLALPPIEEQRDIVANVEPFKTLIEQEASKLDRLLTIKSALMSDLLTGRKRVTDALPMAAE